MAEAKRDQNYITTLLAVSNADGITPVLLWADPTTHRLLVDLPTGSGTVTSVSVTTANGVSGTVATATTTPAITIVLGAITPSSVNISGLTASELVATDASKNLVSLAVATYPSLVELAYVKGVTSAIQTQLNGKQASGSYGLTTSPLSQFASTTSLQLLGVISDETGSGALVFGTSPAITTPTGIVKGDVGLGNVDNTTDAGKPVSTAQQTALNLKANLASPTFTGTVTIPTGASITTPVLTGLPTGTGVASAATASTLASRDANANLSADNLLQGYTTTVTAAGTTTLTVDSTYLQFFTGSTTQTLTLPVASTLVLGQQFYIRNNSTGAVTVNSSGANVVRILAGNTRAIVTCILTSGTTAASWSTMYVGISIADGKILTASNTLTLAGTDATTMTFPATSATIARTDAAQSFTGVQTFVAPILGTPTSATLTNATGLPVSTGIAGLGTGVATALAVNNNAAGGYSPIDGTATITNKRPQPRTNSTTTAATLAPSLATANVYYRTTQTATLTIDAPIGTPVIGETILIYIDSVAAQTLTINATYKVFGAAFPATTTAGKTFMMSCQFNGTDWKTLWANAI